MSTYTFTRDADEDVTAIWLATEERWGETQADNYVDDLFRGCERVVENIAATRALEGLASVRFFRCQRHYLFYTQQGDDIVIIAILHERMDLPNRLAKRLDQM